MNNFTTSEVLDLAADEIQRRGWTQGTGWDGALDGSALCLEGALMAAIGVDQFRFADAEFLNTSALMRCDAYRATQEYLGVVRPYDWNDTPGRTEEDVIAVLRAAAAVERAKEAAYAPRKVAA